MHFSKTYSVQTKLLNAQQIDVEVDITNGLHSFNIVGLPSKSIAEARDRVSAAIKNLGLTSPKQKNQKVVVSLAPANTPKDGVCFDLPIALSYLKASEQIDFDSEGKMFFGELSLDSKLRSTKSVLPAILFAKEKGFAEIFIPSKNRTEASLISGIKIFAAENLEQIINHLTKKKSLTPVPYKNIAKITKSHDQKDVLSEIKGNELGKRGLLIAAAGNHNICFYGPPGTGKTILSKALAHILPKLNIEKIIESSSIHSELIRDAPFRSPHHTSSYTSIIGGGVSGGSELKHGEITMAHNGVLFLDEFPEFDRRVIESLRQPLEDGEITISRSAKSIRFPANFLFVASMNPCPCGYFGSNAKECSCTPKSIENYRKKVSGPIMDRIDMWISVSKTDYEQLSKSTRSKKLSETKGAILSVKNARKIQHRRQSNVLNSDLSISELNKYCKLDSESRLILNEASEKMRLSARSYHKILKVARTIADLDEKKQIKKPHILEALQFRNRNF